MKKRLLALALVLTFVLLFTACDEIGSTFSTNPEDVYSELDTLVNSPDRTTNLTGSFTFVAYIACEPFEQELEGTTYMYQEVYISRNLQNSIYLDVTGITETLPENSYATITGKINGSIYWTEDNKKVEVLDIKASKMAAFTPSEDEPNTENNLQLSRLSTKGTYEFVGAHRAKSSFEDVIVLYFNYTNTGADTNTKINDVDYMLTKKADIYHGDSKLKTTSQSAKELDPNALNATDMQAYTYSGKTQLYYMTFAANKDVAADEPIYIEVYNDNFECTNIIEVPVSKNLAAMKGE